MNRLDFVIAGDHSGERLDKYLSDQVETLSRSAASRLIEDGKVTVGAKSVKKNTASRC